MKVVIAPYAKELPEGKKNAKNYPYWQDVVDVLTRHGATVYQLSLLGEPQLSNVILKIGLPLSEVRKLVEEADVWVSVDSFLQHLTTKQGVVIWSKSDPLIFGYPHNINLLKDRKYLRKDQFGFWTACEYDEEAFVDPEVVLEAVVKLWRDSLTTRENQVPQVA